MIGRIKPTIDVNTVGKSVDVFLQYYNDNVPSGFPQATLKALDRFKTLHPGLFKGKGDWTIEKHRKKLMDWLVSNREEI